MKMFCAYTEERKKKFLQVHKDCKIFTTLVSVMPTAAFIPSCQCAEGFMIWSPFFFSMASKTSLSIAQHHALFSSMLLQGTELGHLLPNATRTKLHKPPTLHQCCTNAGQVSKKKNPESEHKCSKRVCFFPIILNFTTDDATYHLLVTLKTRIPINHNFLA